jgi:hypothetical protein
MTYKSIRHRPNTYEIIRMNTKGNLAFHWNESDGNAIVTHVHTDCPGLENSLSQQSDKPPLFSPPPLADFEFSNTILTHQQQIFHKKMHFYCYDLITCCYSL